MTYDYSKSGMPANRNWENAAEVCHKWITQSMGHLFKPAQIDNFMLNQPVAAAKRLLEMCSDISEEAITLTLLGPSKEWLQQPAGAAMSRVMFGERTMDLFEALADPSKIKDEKMKHDCQRLSMAEAISMMNDQLVGRAKMDQHHGVRKQMLSNFTQMFAAYKGHDEKLDRAFEDALKKSKTALDALDAAAPKRRAPKPPGM